MSYLPTGDLSTVADVARVSLDVVQDPFLPEVTCLVMRMAALEQGRKPPTCPKTALSTRLSQGRGIGLRYAVIPLRVTVKVRENPVLTPVVATGVVAGLFLLGYAIGRSK